MVTATVTRTDLFQQPLTAGTPRSPGRFAWA